MVKSRDISVSLTKGDISPEPQPHLQDSDDNGQEQQRPSMHESTIEQDDSKTTGSLPVTGITEKQQVRHLRSASSSDASDFSNGSEFIPPKVPNPFYFRVHLTAADKIKVAFMTVLIFPLRVLLVLFFLFLTWLGCFVGLLGYSEQELESKPIQGWRREWREKVRTMVFWAFRTFLLRVELRGERARPTEAPILVAGPHSSFYDFVTVIANSPVPSAVIRDETGTVVISTILRFIQPVFVKRSSKESRQTTLSEIKNRATSQEPWSQIVIFPEGTCSNGSVLLKFKQGAFSAGVPVQPVLIRYPNKLNTLTWTWDGPSALKTMWLTTCQWQTRMVIEYLPVYRPSAAECKDPGLFAYNVRQLMAAALGVGTTEFGYDDLRFLDTGDVRQPHHTLAIVKLLKFRAKSGLIPDQISLDIAKVSSLITETERAGRPSGRLTRSELLAALGVRPSEVAKEFFDILEMEEDVYRVDEHHKDNGTDQETAQQVQVDPRVLLAALHLANRDGESAFRCLSGEPVVITNHTTSSLATSTASPSININGIIANSNDDVVGREPGATDDGSVKASAVPVLTQKAFYRLCWLAMQMPRRDAEQLFEHFRPSPLTLPVFRELLAKHANRCKGIVYFDSARRLNLDDGDQAPLESTPKIQRDKEDDVESIKASQKSSARKIFVRKVDSNGRSDEKITAAPALSAAVVTSQSKRQKAE
ncbi:lysophosphatidylcholine acyltransferase 1-like isoform X2 [Varroa jacobsoni]|uniref:lysophosphatidylcholine acyltransferase 1-like isoform X2 n=1 Tax=Varroa jacobsoni TaxID=62625 RepID=UPI000BF40D03|nr:lysophosphatidylcholine acyltransferase 1-like isoform X2 [Varroa jacobsoni]